MIQYVAGRRAFEIVWDGPFDISGYGVASRSFVKALSGRRDTRIRTVDGSRSLFFKMVKEKGIPQNEIDIFDKLKATKVSTNAIYVNNTVPELFKNTVFRKNVGFTMYESDGLSINKVSNCNRMDEIWVPSKFCQRMFTNSGVKVPIYVIPIPIDTVRYNPDVKPIEIENKASFNFLAIGDYTYRKGWDILFKAFWLEFKKDEDVTLTVKTFSGAMATSESIRQDILSLKKEMGLKETPRILFFSQFLREDQMPSLYKAADVFVLPSRGEGFGLPYAEAAAVGLPIIATNWSGHLDFLNKNNSYLIDSEGLKPIQDIRMLSIEPGYRGKRFAEPSLNHLRQLMRYVFEHQSEAKEKAIKARNYLVENFNANKIVESIIKRIQ